MAYQPFASSPAPTLENVSPTVPGQTVFVLSSAPAPGSVIYMRINQVRYVQGAEFTLSGNTLTWLSLFTLDPSDEVIVEYFI